ncbi:MAG: beta-ketoacyl-ACP synthase III [Planctomycetota bacterium]
MIHVGILSTGSGLPDNVRTNADLEKMVETSDEWIRTRSGIRERRIAAPDIATSDLGAVAARQCLARAGVPAADVDCILTATLTPDMLLPSTACFIQAAIGAENAAAMDVAAACSGFVYALELGRGLVAASGYRRVLVVASEVLSKFVDWTDRSTCVLFGDGAGAALIGPVAPGAGHVILGGYMRSDGRLTNVLNIPAGGSRTPATHESVDKGLHYIKMDGAETFRNAVRAMEEALVRVLERCGRKPEDLDWLIPHQANIRIIEAMAKRFGMPMEKVVINLDRYGNMSAASIIVALDGVADHIKKGELVALVTVGAGMTWGATLIEW